LATDPNERDLPPKPTWMRWRTYNYCVQRYGVYQDILDFGVGELVAKLKGFSLMQEALAHLGDLYAFARNLYRFLLGRVLLRRATCRKNADGDDLFG
jgi:hypothetical protein